MISWFALLTPFPVAPVANQTCIRYRLSIGSNDDALLNPSLNLRILYWLSCLSLSFKFQFKYLVSIQWQEVVVALNVNWLNRIDKFGWLFLPFFYKFYVFESVQKKLPCIVSYFYDFIFIFSTFLLFFTLFSVLLFISFFFIIL